jgi:hypothetical protein
MRVEAPASIECASCKIEPLAYPHFAEAKCKNGIFADGKLLKLVPRQAVFGLDVLGPRVCRNTAEVVSGAFQISLFSLILETNGMAIAASHQALAQHLLRYIS